MTSTDPYADITPADSTQTFAEALADPDYMKLAVPLLSVGEPATDFDLAIYDFSSGARVKTDSTFHLQGVAANQPVALIFGSYT